MSPPQERPQELLLQFASKGPGGFGSPWSCDVNAQVWQVGKNFLKYLHKIRWQVPCVAGALLSIKYCKFLCAWCWLINRSLGTLVCVEHPTGTFCKVALSSSPTEDRMEKPCQVKAAYKKKVLTSHPDKGRPPGDMLKRRPGGPSTSKWPTEREGVLDVLDRKMLDVRCFFWQSFHVDGILMVYPSIIVRDMRWYVPFVWICRALHTRPSNILGPCCWASNQKRHDSYLSFVNVILPGQD